MVRPDRIAPSEGADYSAEPAPLSRRAKIIVGSLAAVMVLAWGSETAHQAVDAHGCEVKPDNNPAHLATAPFADFISLAFYSDKDARQCP